MAQSLELSGPYSTPPLWADASTAAHCPTLGVVWHDQSDSGRAELDLDSREDRTYLSREVGPRAALGNRPPSSAPPYGARAAVAAARASSAYFDITES